MTSRGSGHGTTAARKIRSPATLARQCVASGWVEAHRRHFGSWQWIVLLIIRDMPEFENFLRSEIYGKGPGFVSCCLALADADKLSRPERNELCRRIMFEKRAHLIASLAVERHGTMTVNLLSKLDIEASSPALERDCH
jgi:hypothetical protein